MKKQKEIKDIDLFLREEYEGNIYIMPLTNKSKQQFKDQLHVLSIIGLDIKNMSKKVSNELFEESSIFLKEVKKALNNKDLFFKINKDIFINIHTVFKDSFLNKKIVEKIKIKNNLEKIYLSKINLIFENILYREKNGNN